VFFKFFEFCGTVFASVFQPFIEMRRVIRRWKYMIEAHLLHIYYFFLIRYGLRAVSNLLNREITFFENFAIFGTVFTLVFEPFVKTRRAIRSWKAKDEAKLSHVEMFFRFLTVFS